MMARNNWKQQACHDLSSSHHQSVSQQVLLHFIDVGDGQAIVIEFNEQSRRSRFYFYDGGFDPKSKINVLHLERAFKELSCTLDGVILSEPLEGHRTCLGFLLQGGHIKATKLRLVTNSSFDINALLPHMCFEKVTESCLSVMNYSTSGVHNSDVYFNESSFHFWYGKECPLQLCFINPSFHSGVKIASCLQLHKDNYKDLCLQIRPSDIDECPPVFLPSSCSSTEHTFDVVNDLHISVLMVPPYVGECYLPQSMLECLPSYDEMRNLALLLAIFNRRDLFFPVIDRLNKEHILKKSADAFEFFLRREGDAIETCVNNFILQPRKPNSVSRLVSNSQALWYNDHKDLFPKWVLHAVENEQEGQLRRLLYLKRCLKWAHFYKNVVADLYVAASKQTSSFNEVLTGIIIASVWKQTKCRIALTNNLQLSLDKIFSKKIREIVCSLTEIWYLNDYQCSNQSLSKDESTSYFTVVAFCQHDSDSNKPSVLVNPFTHDVSVKYMKSLNISDVKGATDVEKAASSASAYRCRAAVHTNKGKPLRQPPVSETVVLEKYLEHLGYPKSHRQHKLSTVLECLLGILVVSQLKHIEDPSNSGYSEALPLLLDLDTNSSSKFQLNHTKTAAIFADIKINVPPTIRVIGKKLHGANMKIKYPKTPNIKVQLCLKFSNNTKSIELSEHLKIEGSYGKTVPEFILGSSSCQQHFMPKTRLKIGEMIHILLKEGEAAAVLRHLPHCLSMLVCSTEVHYYLTTINMDSNKCLVQAHIYSDAPTEDIILCNKKVRLSCRKLVVHIYPPYEDGERMVQIEGEFTLNKEHQITLNTTLTSEVPKDMKCTFTGSITVKQVFETFDMSYGCDGLKYPFQEEDVDNLKDEVKYEAGFTLSQTLPECTTVELTSFFFNVRCKNLQHLLPPSILPFVPSEKSAAPTTTCITCPCNDPAKCGFEAQLMLELNNICAKPIRCLLSVCPCVSATSTVTSYYYSITVQRIDLQEQHIKGSSVYDMLATLSADTKKVIQTKIENIPNIGYQIFNSVLFKELILQGSLSNRSIEKLKFNAYIPCLKVFAGKIALKNCDVIFLYSEGILTLECRAKLILLHKFIYDVEVTLPTCDNDGTLCFENDDEELTLREVFSEFGWLSKAVASYPILSSVLEICVRKLKIVFGCSSESADLQVLQAEITVFMNEFDIEIFKLSKIELTVMINLLDTYKVDFSVKAFIAESLYAELKYNTSDHLLSGNITVPCSGKVTALDALQAFHVDPTNCIGDGLTQLSNNLQKHFMDVLKSSDNQQSAGCGLTAVIGVELRPPVRSLKVYLLKHVCLELKDVLRIRNCVIDSFQFKYTDCSDCSEATEPIAVLSAVIKVVDSSESMVIKFDLTSQEDDATILNASVQKGTQGMKVRSLLELCGCDTPKLPKVDLPPIFDLEVIAGSISFTLRPFKVCSVDVQVKVPNWVVFNDPRLQVQNLIIQVTWKSGSLPELTFTDSSLIFMWWILTVTGNISAKRLWINCCTPEVSSSMNEHILQFESLLSDYSPSSVSPCPTVPKDIDLPSMTVHSIELDIHLEEHKKRFRLKTVIAPNKCWTVDVGNDVMLNITKIGGAVEWTRTNSGTSTYAACIFGYLELQICDKEIYVEMSLGNGDSILLSQVSDLDYGKVADYLLYHEVVSPDESSVTSLVPPNVKELAPSSCTMAINITKKMFIFSGLVDEWGHCFMCVDLQGTETKYVVALTLKEGAFCFSMLSEQLAFMDEYIIVQHVSILVSSVKLQQLNDVIKPFEQSQVSSRAQQAFSSLSKVLDDYFMKEGIECGTTLYAVLDFSACMRSKCDINQVFELGDERLANRDIIVKIFIPQVLSESAGEKVLELHAYLSRINLCGILRFSNVKLLYKVYKKEKSDTSSSYELELSGVVTFRVDLDANERCISFDGYLSIKDGLATFITTTHCGDVVNQPAGLNMTLKNLRLRLDLDLREKHDKVKAVSISGNVRVGRVCLEAKFLLKGLTFQVFHVRLVNQLLFSCLLEQICHGWSASSLTVVIKEGYFYYARQNTEFQEDGHQLVKYEAGYHIECVINLINSDFRIKADISHDRSQLAISGRSIEKIDFGFAKLTGTGAYLHEGPELSYANRTLSLKAGIELFNDPWFEGELSYCFSDSLFRGTITYLGRIFFIKNPKISVEWSKKKGFQIVHFPILDDIPGFDFLGAVAKFAKVIYNLASGLIRWGFRLSLATDENPDPNRYLLKLIIKGDISVTVLGFIECKLIPLPDIPLRIPKIDNFTFASLPKYIAQCLWESAGDICKSLLSYLNPFELAKKLGKRILDAVTGAITSVVEIGKKIVKKVWGWCKRIFGFSAFIYDSDTSSVLGYICAGKGGREFCDIEYIVNHFGPYLAVHALGEVARDIHRNANACMNAERKDDDEELRQKLDELEKHTGDLRSSLHIAADEILTARNIKTKIYNNQIHIEWEACNESGETVFNDDKGDIEHYLTVTVTTIHFGSSIHQIETKSIYEGVWTAQQSVNDHTQSEDKKADKHPDPPNDTQKCTKVVGGSQSKEKEAKKYVQRDVDCKNCETEVQQLKDQERASRELQGKGQNLHEVKNETESNTKLQSKKSDHELEESTEWTEQTETAEDNEEPEVNEEESKPLLEEKRPSTVIDIDDTIFKHSVKVTVSVQPMVTLRVMTPSEPRVVGEDVAGGTDKTWMTQIKKEIKETGREKEVTLCGKKVCKEFLTKLALQDLEIIVTADCQFSENGEVASINGVIQPVPGIQGFSLQVVDSCDHTTIIKEYMLPMHTLKDGFQIDLTLKDLPDKSHGPYITHVMAVDSNFCANESVLIPELEIPRQTSPADLCLSFAEEDAVKLSWLSPGPHDCDDKTDDCVSFYKVVLLLTFSEDLTDDSSGSVVRKDKTPIEVPIPDYLVSKSRDRYECDFNLKEVLSLANLPHETGALLEFKVSAYGPSKLPSQPKFIEFILVAPPKYRKTSNPKGQPGLQLSWKSATHAVSYLVEAYNKESPVDSAVFSKQYDHDKSMKSAFDMDVILDFNDLSVLSSGCCYQFQVHSLGFGEDLHRCLIPTLAIEELHVMAVQIEFLPEVDTILVHFDPCLAGFSFKVSLYRVLNGLNPQIFESKDVCCRSSHSVTQKFRGFKKCWGIALGPECCVLAWVHNPLLSPIQIGISTNKLQVLKSPSFVNVAYQTYNPDFSIEEIALSWPEVSGVHAYQYGLYDTVTGNVLLHRETKDNEALIEFSAVQYDGHNYVHVECFVKSIGNATFLSSDPVLATKTYQCIVNAIPKIVVYTSVQLHSIWSKYFFVFTARSCLILPRIRYLLIPTCTKFPDIPINSTILHKFWHPKFPLNEGFFAGILSNGVPLYAYDLLENVEESKWKNIYPLTQWKPEKWHTEIQLLLYIRYSITCPEEVVKIMGKLDCELKVIVKEDAKRTEKVTSQVKTGAQKDVKKAESGMLSKLIKKGSEAAQSAKRTFASWMSPKEVTAFSVTKSITLRAKKSSCAQKGIVHLVGHIEIKDEPKISLKISNSNKKQSECKVNLFMRFV